MHYRLKKYFDGIPTNQIPTTSPFASMSDLEWQALVAKWTNPKNMVWVSCHIYIFYLIEFPMDLVI
jgi:hypothetical protein